MPSTATTVAIIHFIGLAVFSREFGPKPGPLQAILPRVPAVATPRQPVPQHNLAHVAVETEVHRAGSVEPHTAILAFPAGAYVVDHGWKPNELEIDGAYWYVRLNGEQITFSDSAPARVIERRGAPTSTQPVSQADIGLPHLRGCFKNVADLKPAYRGPGFAGAVAVFTFPDGVATAQACSANSTNTAVQPSRIDTQVSMPVRGNLIITAGKGASKKDIVVRGDTKVIVGNLPTTWLEGDMTEHASAPHYEVYYAMGATNTGSAGDFACALNQHTITPCPGAPTPTIMPQSGSNAQTQIPHWPDPNAHVNYQCSNTQWP
jgi:hypothetical protein